MKLYNLDSLTKSLRSFIILATNLDGKFVRNSLSKFGTNLDQRSSQNIFETICNDNDVLVLFELQLRSSDSDCSMTEEDGTISYFKAFRLKLIIYGKRSNWTALNLIAKFRSDAFRSRFVNDGIYFESASEPDCINEFVNDVMWNRSDLAIDFNCQLTIVPDIMSYEQLNLNDISVLECE